MRPLCWSFPFLLSFAALRFDSSLEFLQLRWLTSRSGRTVSVAVFVGLVVWLSVRPSYTERWQQVVTIQESLEEGAASGTLSLKSQEYLDGARAQWDDHVTPVDFVQPPAGGQQLPLLGQGPAVACDDLDPVDLRKSKRRGWNPFFKDLARRERKST